MTDTSDTFDREEDHDNEQDDTDEDAPVRVSDQEVVENIRVDSTPSEVLGTVMHTQNRDVIQPTADNRRQYYPGLHPPVHRFSDDSKVTAERNVFDGTPPGNIEDHGRQTPETEETESDDGNLEESLTTTDIDHEGDDGQELNL